MAKVIATQRGYFGKALRDIGDVFDVPDEIMADERLRPSWVEIVGKATAEPDAAEPEKPAKAKPGPKAKPAPFADAPEPVRVQNEINNALGTAEPDWVAPAGGDI
jgi:hypothetical protein